MLFNVPLAGTATARLAALDDTLRPLFFGLRAAGHGVVAFGRAIEALPAVNLVVADSTGTGMALAARARGGRSARIGLLCPDDVDTLAADPQRWKALRLVAETADFVWTCGPTAALAGVVAPERNAVVPFGCHPSLLGRAEADPGRRDSGVILYGVDGSRPTRLAERLTQSGVSTLFVRAGHFPDYIVTDLLRRARLVIVVRGDATERTSPAMRIMKAICNGAAVIAEPGTSGELPLAPYVVECAYDDIPARCQAMLREDNVVQRGLDALERFRRETSMADGLTAALAVAAAAGGGR